MEETYALAKQMILLGGTADSEADAEKQCRTAVSSGAALERFLENIREQGGDPDTVLAHCGKRRSPFRAELKAEQSGFIFIDAYKTGIAGVTLGVGRNRTTDAVCPDAGIILHKTSGESVEKGETIMELFGKDSSCLPEAERLLSQAVSYTAEPPEKHPLIYKIIK